MLFFGFFEFTPPKMSLNTLTLYHFNIVCLFVLDKVLNIFILLCPFLMAIYFSPGSFGLIFTLVWLFIMIIFLVCSLIYLFFADFGNTSTGFFFWKYYEFAVIHLPMKEKLFLKNHTNFKNHTFLNIYIVIDEQFSFLYLSNFSIFIVSFATGCG